MKKKFLLFDIKQFINWDLGIFEYYKKNERNFGLRF